MFQYDVISMKDSVILIGGGETQSDGKIKDLDDVTQFKVIYFLIK